MYRKARNRQNARQNRNKKMRNKPFGCDEKFKYLGATLTIQNCIHEGIKSRGELGEDLMPSSLGSFVFQFPIQKYKA